MTASAPPSYFSFTVKDKLEILGISQKTPISDNAYLKKRLSQITPISKNAYLRKRLLHKMPTVKIKIFQKCLLYIFHTISLIKHYETLSLEIHQNRNVLPHL